MLRANTGAAAVYFDGEKEQRGVTVTMPRLSARVPDARTATFVFSLARRENSTTFVTKGRI